MTDISQGTGAASHQVFESMVNANYEKKQIKGEQERSHVQSDEEAQKQAASQRVAQRSGAEGVGSTRGAVTQGATEAEQIRPLLTSRTPSKKPGLSEGWANLINVEETSVKSSKGVNLIAIMSEVMILQAKSNQDFFSSLWQGASAAMSMEAELAPVVAHATLKAGLAQAAQSKAEADNALVEGVVNITMFGVSCIAGGLSAFASEGEEGVDDAANEGKNVTKDTKDAENTEDEISEGEEEAGGAKDEDGLPQDEETPATTTKATEQEEAEVQQTTKAKAEKELAQGTKEQENVSQQTDQTADKAREGRWKRFKRAWSKGSPKLKFLQELGTQSMAWNGLGQGITAIATYVYKNKIAMYQKSAAQWQAVEKMGDIQVQFFGQAFGRAEGMSQQAQQNVNTALQLLEGIVQAITQTVTSGFSNI